MNRIVIGYNWPPTNIDNTHKKEINNDIRVITAGNVFGQQIPPFWRRRNRFHTPWWQTDGNGEAMSSSSRSNVRVFCTYLQNKFLYYCQVGSFNEILSILLDGKKATCVCVCMYVWFWESVQQHYLKRYTKLIRCCCYLTNNWQRTHDSGEILPKQRMKSSRMAAKAEVKNRHIHCSV